MSDDTVVEQFMRELSVVLRDEFIAKFEETQNSIALTFSDGTKIRLTAEAE